jgi:hypothetical protein
MKNTSNQNVMKTKKFTITMKTMATIIVAFLFTAFLNAQFVTPSPDSPVTQVPSEEVRTGSTVVYDLDNGNHTAGERYRWLVTGGIITAVNGAGAITGGNTVEFADDAHTITVDWDQAPGSAITSLAASIQVQKISGDACPSQIQTLDIDVWNLATAAITTGTEEVCSGGSPSVATIPVALTGAPDGTVDGFSVDYSFTIPVGLSALDGTATPVAATGTLTTDGSSVNLTLPVTMINTTNGDLDFVVSLTAMNDDFTGAGSVAASGTYTITVHPVPTTGDIESSFSLTR